MACSVHSSLRVLLSAPATPAANTATVLRNQLTYGSRCVRTRLLVVALMCMADGEPPAASTTRDHNQRRRHFRDRQEMMCSQTNIERNLTGGIVDAQTGGCHGSQIFDAGGDGKSDVLRRRCAGMMIDRRVDAYGRNVRIVSTSRRPIRRAVLTLRLSKAATIHQRQGLPADRR